MLTASNTVQSLLLAERKALKRLGRLDETAQQFADELEGLVSALRLNAATISPGTLEACPKPRDLERLVNEMKAVKAELAELRRKLG